MCLYTNVWKIKSQTKIIICDLSAIYSNLGKSSVSFKSIRVFDKKVYVFLEVIENGDNIVFNVSLIFLINNFYYTYLKRISTFSPA